MPIRRALDWLDDRTGYRRVVELALEEPVRGGTSWAYVFGSVLTFILLMQAVTGVLLALYYSPSATDAWASVAYIQTQVSMGWFIRGMHSHGASAMVVVAGMHLLQVAIYGAYKKPREVTWLVGALLLALIFAFALTGYLLPWDQKGYWATKVATGIMGSSPVIGGWLREVVQGGNEYGNLTLTRFFAIHVFILPAAVFVLVGIHIALFRKHGVTPRWGRSDVELDAATRPFWPDQLFKDMVAILVVFGVLAMLTIRNHGVPLEAPADPASSYDARPEWYFLPLFQMLKYFHGALEQVAALGAPVVVGAVLFALPFVDRGPDRSPLRRAPFLVVLLGGMAGAGVLVFLAMKADRDDTALAERQELARERAEEALKLAELGVPAAGGSAVWENDPLFMARRIFGERCAGCHAGNERKGPVLGSGYNSRAWIRAYLLDPDGDAFFGPTKDIHKMKPVKLVGAELDAVIEYVYAQTGASDANAEQAATGKRVIDEGSCSDCHYTDGTSFDGEGPNLAGRGSREWMTGFIADPGDEKYFGKLNEMTAFQGKLGENEIAALADLVRSWQTQPLVLPPASRPAQNP